MMSTIILGESQSEFVFFLEENMILLHCLFVKTVHHQFCYLRHLPKKNDNKIK